MCAVKHKTSQAVMTLWKMCWNTQMYIHAYAKTDTLYSPPPPLQVTSFESKQSKWQDRAAIVFILHTSNTACDWLWRPPVTHRPVVQLHLERGQTLVLLLECACVCHCGSVSMCANTVVFRFIAGFLIVASYTVTVYNTTADRN